MGKQINKIKKNKSNLDKNKYKLPKYLTSVATVIFKDGEREIKEDFALPNPYYYKE